MVLSTMREKPASGFKIEIRGLPEEVGYTVRSSEEDFMYDAVDADLRIEINGRPPFPTNSYRLSEDGFLHSIPILDFIWNFVVCCKNLKTSNFSTERVRVRSTDYILEFERQDDSVTARVRENDKAGAVFSETTLTLEELLFECKSVADVELASIFRENPALRGNPHLKRLSSEVEALNQQLLSTTKKVRDRF